MRNLFRFILRNQFVFLFLFLEGISFILIFQYNTFQKSNFVEQTRNVTSYLNQRLQGFREYFYLKTENNILSLENSRLRNMLELQTPESLSKIGSTDTLKRISYVYIPAKVISNSVNKQYNSITIDKGKLQGVDSEMAVISDQGVVGIIIGASNNFATVLPILNRNFRLSAKIKRNNYFGIIEWEGINPKSVKLKEIPVHTDVQVGDTVVTSGYSAIFPEGIMVGIVETVTPSDGNFHEVNVELATNYHNIIHVYVIQNIHKDEQESLEEGLNL